MQSAHAITPQLYTWYSTCTIVRTAWLHSYGYNMATILSKVASSTFAKKWLWSWSFLQYFQVIDAQKSFKQQQCIWKESRTHREEHPNCPAVQDCLALGICWEFSMSAFPYHRVTNFSLRCARHGNRRGRQVFDFENVHCCISASGQDAILLHSTLAMISSI